MYAACRDLVTIQSGAVGIAREDCSASQMGGTREFGRVNTFPSLRLAIYGLDPELQDRGREFCNQAADALLPFESFNNI